MKKFSIIGLVILILLLVVGLLIVIKSNNDYVGENMSDTLLNNEDVMLDEDKANDIDDTMEKDETMVEDEDDEMEKTSGAYIPYNKAELTSDKNVIFFAASWCPTCRALDNAINTDLKSIPANLTILKADYDSEVELKQKYGVTYQHTLVQVDEDGNMKNKWSGSQNIAKIVMKLV